MSERTKNICVVGAGNMGQQISLLAALKGFETYCTDISVDQLAKAEAFAAEYLPQRVAKQKISQVEAEAARMRLHFTTDLSEAGASADFVIEAAAEKLELKRALFAQLDAVCPPHSVLATNSSFIYSSMVADATRRPEKVCNMHFFSPALVMSVVEVVKGPHTSSETAEKTIEIARLLGKNPVVVNKEVYGFVVNRILFAMLDEAFSLVSKGIASVEAIDVAVEGALNHPLGPFRVIDSFGVDLYCDIQRGRAEQTGDPNSAPPQFVVDMVRVGKLGKKSGSGFYDYTP